MSYTVREIRREGGINESGVRSYTRTFQVESTEQDSEPIDVDAAVGLAYLQAYPTDPYALLKNKRVSQTKDLYVWDASYQYDSGESKQDKNTAEAGDPYSPPSSAGNNNSTTNPTERPWKFAWGNVQNDLLLTKDLSTDGPGGAGKPMVNSAGVPFDPPLTIPNTDLQLKITAYALAADVGRQQQYINSVNEFAIWGWPAEWIRCTGYEQNSQYESNFGFFWEFSVTLQFRYNGWNPIKVLDAGTLYNKDHLLPLQPIIGFDGSPVTHPVPLNGFGEPLNAGDDPVYLEFQGYYLQDFANIISGP